MKFINLFLLPVILLVACNKADYHDSPEELIAFSEFERIDLTKDVKKYIQLKSPQEIVDEGNIVVVDKTLLLISPGRGIHIIDNSNPEEPINSGFINLPGVTNCSMKGEHLFADMGSHLVTLRIPSFFSIDQIEVKYFAFNPQEKERYGEGHPYYYYLPTGKQVFYNKASEHGDVYRFEKGKYTYMRSYDQHIIVDMYAEASSMNKSTAGSMASWAIHDNTLFLLNKNSDALLSYDISRPYEVQLIEQLYLSWNIETMFPYKEFLFIGTSSGMHILDASNPSSIKKLSSIEHMSACDPVVAKDNRAYVTLRSGNRCEGWSNQLEIYDISDLRNPKLLETILMTSPKGLGISQRDRLYVCDDKAGIRIFDAEDEFSTPIQVGMLPIYNAYDIIVLSDKHLIIRSDDGISQYDCSNINQLKLLSKL